MISKELFQDLHIAVKHTDGIDFIKISKFLNVPVSTTGEIIRKWKEPHFTMNRPRPDAPHYISTKKVKQIIRRVVQESRRACGELQEDLDLAATSV